MLNQSRADDSVLDPDALAKFDVVVTTYTTLASEHGTYAPAAAKDEGKKAKAKPKKKKDDFVVSDDSDEFGSTLIGKKKPSKAASSKAPLCALFKLRWWRIVLG